MSSGKQTSKPNKDERRGPLFTPRQQLVIFFIVLLAGWLLILNKNQWYVQVGGGSYLDVFVSPAAIFMCIGWLAFLLSALFLWRAGMSAANEGEDDEEDFWQPIGRRHELEVEKTTLLKAIKEIEFDHNLGKMSDADANDLTAVYRSRAIAVIKALDELDGGNASEATLRERIEKDLRARLEVDKATARAKKKKSKRSSDRPKAAAESKRTAS